MCRLRHILIGILAFALLTVWVKERWAISALEAMILLFGAALSLRVAIRKRSPGGGIVMLFPASMALWAVLQLCFHWTIVKSDTTEALLYWLSAACLVWLGHGVCGTRSERLSFLKAILIVGAVICLLGVIQLFTSDGRVFWLFASGYSSLVIGPFVSQNDYASFVQLLLPISLALAFKDRQHSKAYIVVAAALVASVIASGSRAGTGIVIAESALAFLLWRRADKEAVGRRWVEFAVLAAAFTAIVGYQYLWDRLSGQQDPYAVRREFVESSIAMVRAQPLHGFGLGTWPSAYKPYAIIDTGAVANHAHNEWVQWAAEGGLPAFALMLALLLFCLPSALRSVWGLGVIAVFAHSLVDYPFVRLGLAAWIFVLIGVLSGYGFERRRIERGAISASCVPTLPIRTIAALSLPIFALGIYQSLRIGWADTLYHRGTPEGVSHAIALWPEQPEYHFGLAQIDPEHAVQHLRYAVALNPFLTSARIALASQMEAAGDNTGAETNLLEAARRDRQYTPAWALANFYFRANRPDQFWRWARVATGISYGGLSPLFDLCFTLTDDAQAVFQRVVGSRLLVEREFMAYLIGKDRLADTGPVAVRIATNASEDDREVLLSYIDRALDAGQFQPARQTWNELASRRLVPYETSKPGILINGDFRQPLLGHAFDWRIPATGCAIAARTLSTAPALEVSFSGKEPENCEFLDHYVDLSKGAQYVLRYQYRTSDLPKQTGLHWFVNQGEDQELSASDEWAAGEWHFPAPADTVRVVLGYHRALGTRRIEGTILLRQVRLQEEKNVSLSQEPPCLKYRSRHAAGRYLPPPLWEAQFCTPVPRY
jgi:O-antigen ligase